MYESPSGKAVERMFGVRVLHPTKRQLSSSSSLCVLDDSVAEPDDVRQRVPALHDADEDERLAKVEGALYMRHSHFKTQLHI